MTDFTTALRFYLAGGAQIRIPKEAGGGVSQSLQIIEQAAQLRRDVNGGLIRLQNPSFRKYRTEISVNGAGSPTLGNLNPGDLLTIHCIAEITQRVASGAATLVRDPVPGSVRCYDNNSRRTADPTVSGRSITGASGATFLVFRPILECAVEAYSYDRNETSAEVSWSLIAVEV